MNNKQDSILKVETPECYWEKCDFMSRFFPNNWNQHHTEHSLFKPLYCLNWNIIRYDEISSTLTLPCTVEFLQLFGALDLYVDVGPIERRHLYELNT